MAKKWPENVVQRLFIKGHSFPIGLYLNHLKKKIAYVTLVSKLIFNHFIKVWTGFPTYVVSKYICSVKSVYTVPKINDS